MVDKKELVRLLFLELWKPNKERINLDSDPINIIGKVSPELSPFQVNSLWEKIRKNVVGKIKNQIEYCNNKNITPNYQFIDPEKEDKLVRSDIYDGKDHKKELIIFYRGQLKKALYSLNWQTFEIFCAYLLQLFEFKDVHYTRGSKDNSIDFYGFNDFKKVGRFYHKRKKKIAIIGQAKKWKGGVGKATMESFVFNYREFKEGKHEICGKLPISFSENVSCNATMMTTSYFTSGANKVAKKYGVELFDGEQIVEELIDALEFTLATNWLSVKVGKKIFDYDKFLNWIGTLKVTISLV